MPPVRPATAPPPGAARPADTLNGLLAVMVRTPEVDLAGGIGRRPVPGAQLGRFLLVHELGRDEGGTVFEAIDQERERPVALKLLRPGPSSAPRGAAWAQREAADFKRLDHPNIVAMLGAGTCPAGAYLVFELLRGRTLRRRLQDGPFDLAGALRIAGDVARALAHAHAVGVVHRGLTASKVFVCDDGSVKVLDFSPGRRLPMSGEASTATEVSPEQQAGWPGDERSDLYALTSLLQQMIASAAGSGRAVSPDGGPPPRRLRRLLEAGHAPDPADRPQSAAEWLDELEAIRIAGARRWSWRGLLSGRILGV